MKNNKRKISLLLIIIGSISIFLGTILYFISDNTNDNPVKNNDDKDNVVQKTPEETVFSWIGTYENGYNKIFVIVHDYDNYNVLVLYQGNDFDLQIKNISYDELKIDDDTFSGSITKVNDQIKVEIKNKNVDFKIDESYSKVEDKEDKWTGIYSNDNAKLFITKINDTYIAFSFNYNYDSKTFTYSQKINSSASKTNKITDTTLEYSSETEGNFVIKKTNDDSLTVKYTGTNSNNSLLNGTYTKLK